MKHRKKNILKIEVKEDQERRCFKIRKTKRNEDSNDWK